MSLKERITSDMTAAMKAKETARLSTLRMVKAVVQNREIEKGGELTDEELTKALQSLVKQRRDSVEQYEQAGRAELAEKERAEEQVLERYLPKQLADDELAELVRQALVGIEAGNRSAMGQAMKAAQAAVAGRAEGGRVAAEVRSQLGL